tara:strand:- start:859 stop:1461 length:603 start_codon:yes stop_codon:yes gene_type:complete
MKSGGNIPLDFYVYYNPKTHLFKLAAIISVCFIIMILPFLVDNTDIGSLSILAVFFLGFCFWGIITAKRITDRRPQVIVDINGIYVRDWHVGTVGWENIDFIAHSSSVRRGIISMLTRSRRGPYLVFKFSNPPKAKSALPFPLSFIVEIWADMEMQEPALMEYGLDTKATDVLVVIQNHIDYWQKNHEERTDNSTTIMPS